MSIARIPIDLTWQGTTGSPGVNVWHCRFDDPNPVAGQLGEILDILQTFYTDVMVCMPPQVTASFGGEAFGVGADQETVFESDTWQMNGTGSSGFMPPANQFYVNWKALTGGRSGRGRTFLGPLSSNVGEANGTPSETYLTAVQLAVDNLVSASLSDLNGALGVWSRVDGVFRDFASGVVPNKFAILRSRRD